MRIAEIYKSVQGEGFLTGTESVFVRTSGCNLRCRWCDTPYASWHPEGDDLSVDDIAREVERLDGSHVVLTGGEPMLFAELIPLCARLHETQQHITIETAGTLFLPVECDLISLSPKLANSTPSKQEAPQWHRRHERTRHAPDVIRRLLAAHTYQVKFVIEELGDCDDVECYLDECPQIDHSRVMLMPQGTSVGELARIESWLEPYCYQHGFQFCPRKQIEWFGLTRGT